MGDNTQCFDRDDILNRLKRVEGQIRGIIRMVEEEQGCIDIITQVTAAKSALNKAGSLILKNYCKNCIRTAAGDEENSSIEELLEIIERSYSF